MEQSLKPLLAQSIRETNVVLKTKVCEVIEQVLSEVYDETVDSLTLEILTETMEEKLYNAAHEYLHREMYYCYECNKEYYPSNEKDHRYCSK